MNKDQAYEAYKIGIGSLIAKTHFEIKTIGADDISVSINGCTPGVVYKLGLAILEFVRMGVLDKDDIRALMNFVKAKYPEVKKQQKRIEKNKKRKKPQCKMIEINGDLAEELLHKLNLVQKGELSEDEIDFEEFIKRAEDENDDNSL